MLHEMLSRLATEYAKERTKPFAQSEFGNFVRHDISIEARKRLVFLPYDLKVKASVGAGVWAAVPWLAFFDPLITESATSGFYVVYLINPDSQTIYLSLNQGAPSIYQEFGEQRGLEVLRRRAIDIQDRVHRFSDIFDRSPIDLGSQASLPKGYMAGHSFGRAYNATEINETAFYNDLENMLSAYELLIDLGGTTPTDSMKEYSGGETVDETRRYVLSRRIERAPNVRPKVLERRGIVCEGCGIDPVNHLGHSGPLSSAPVDVHHLNPLNSLQEGESRRYKIPEDFRVLCPTCHRLIHAQHNADDIDKLRESIKFRPVPKKAQ